MRKYDFFAIPNDFMNLFLIYLIYVRQKYNEYILCRKKNVDKEETEKVFACRKEFSIARQLCPSDWVSYRKLSNYSQMLNLIYNIYVYMFNSERNGMNKERMEIS